MARNFNCSCFKCQWSSWDVEIIFKPHCKISSFKSIEWQS